MWYLSPSSVATTECQRVGKLQTIDVIWFLVLEAGKPTAWYRLLGMVLLCPNVGEGKQTHVRDKPIFTLLPETHTVVNVLP